MTDLSYVDVRPVLAKIADLGREFVLVGGQAVNFWASFYQDRVVALAREAPFTSRDIDFCGDQRAVCETAGGELFFRHGARPILPRSTTARSAVA